MKPVSIPHLKDWYIHMVVIIHNPSERIMTFSLKAMAEQKKVFRSLNTIIDRAHWVYGIPKNCA